MPEIGLSSLFVPRQTGAVAPRSGRLYIGAEYGTWGIDEIAQSAGQIRLKVTRTLV